MVRASSPTSSITLEPTGPGGGYSFEDKITGGRIPKEYIPAGRPGHPGGAVVRRARRLSRLVDVKATLVDGSYHDVDSSEMAFKIAGTMAFREAARKAKPVLLEPIMAVEVVTPEDYMGDVMGDLSSRRGRVGGMEQRGNSQVVRAQVPLSEMFGYSTDLRSRTQGRATYTMQFDSYQQMPSIDPGRDRRARPRRVAPSSHHRTSRDRKVPGHRHGQGRSSSGTSRM